MVSWRSRLSASVLGCPQVVASREGRRKSVKRRTRMKRLEVTEVGSEKKATVLKSLNSGFLLDLGLPVPAYLPNANLPDGVAREVSDGKELWCKGA